MQTFVSSSTSGNYEPTIQYVLGQGVTNAGAPFDALQMLVFNSAGPVPQTRNLGAEGSWNQCEFCVALFLGCTGSVPCPKEYYGRSGSLRVDVASRATPGSFSGTLTNVRLEEWDFDNDRQIPDGGCILLQSASVTTSW